MQKQKTIYIIDYSNKTITTYAKLKDWFSKLPEEIRWGDYCGTVEEFIHVQCQNGNLLIIQNNGHIVSDKVYSPLMYAKLKNIKEIKSNDIALNCFDKIVTTNYKLCNYTLDEYKQVIENNLKVVVVKFSNGDYRFVQV